MTKEEIKQIRIFDLLAKRGIRPVAETAKSYIYRSPFREESTPSFHLIKATNYYKDFGDSDVKAGDNINLVMRMDKLNYSQAFERLSQMNIIPAPDFFSYEPTKEKTIQSQKIYSQPIKHIHLVSYLQKRGISKKIYQCQKHLFECNYTISTKDGKEIEVFNLAWKNDLEGYDLRGTQTGKEKRFINTDGTKYFSTIEGTGHDLNIFEGFFDYLSALEYYKTTQLKNKTIVLNTLNIITFCTPLIESAGQVNLFLDNDQAGQKASEKLLKRFSTCKDRSLEIYPQHKDFNDFLTSHKSNKY